MLHWHELSGTPVPDDMLLIRYCSHECHDNKKYHLFEFLIRHQPLIAVKPEP